MPARGVLHCVPARCRQRVVKPEAPNLKQAVRCVPGVVDPFPPWCSASVVLDATMSCVTVEIDGLANAMLGTIAGRRQVNVGQPAAAVVVGTTAAGDGDLDRSARASQTHAWRAFRILSALGQWFRRARRASRLRPSVSPLRLSAAHVNPLAKQQSV